MDIEKRLDAAGIDFPSNNEKEEVEKVEEKRIFSEQDDALFQQIDAFRRKAEDIQSLIMEKEDRVSALEEQLHAKEVQNQEMQNKLSALEEELDKKQKQADGLVSNVETQVDRVLGEIKQPIDSVSESVEGMQDSIKGMKEDLYEKVHDENVRVYRNIQDLLKERDEADSTFEETKALLKKLGGKIGFLIFLGLLNLGVIVAILLALLDII